MQPLHDTVVPTEYTKEHTMSKTAYCTACTLATLLHTTVTTMCLTH